MKKQIMLFLSALLVVFSVFPAIQSQAAEVATQEFEVPFEVLKVENDDKSTAGDFMKSPAKIVVEDGKTYAYVTLLQSKFWQSLKVETTQKGSFKDAVVVSQDDKANTRVVKFEVQDIKKIMNVKAHIIVTGVPGIGQYDHSYDLRLKFDGSKVPTTPTTPTTPEVKPEEKPEVVKDGAYTIDFKALHEKEDKASSMARYIKAPAALTVKNGKNLVSLTLTNNEQITAFQVEQNGKFVDATVVNTDVKANTRVVSFEVANFSVMNSKVTVSVPAQNYTGNHVVRLAFDKASIKAETPEVEKPAVVKDGAYTIGFKALHEKEDKDSSMTRYMENPAALTVKNGKNLVTLTLTDNQQITAFQVEQDGKFVDATVVSTDEKANKRVVAFEVADLAAIKNAKVTVSVPAQNYTGNHVVRLAFDKDSMKATDVTEKPGEGTEVLFTDIDKSFAKQYIEALAAKQIVKGQTATTFAPNAQITRAQFVVILSRALDLPKKGYEGTFSDVSQNMKSAVYEVEAASRAGIVKGAGNGKFLPNEPITRQQMATMIIQAIEFKDASVLQGVTTTVSFADTKNLTANAKKVIDLAAGLGIINGRVVNGEKVFQPTANATRAEAATMVYQLLEKLK